MKKVRQFRNKDKNFFIRVCWNFVGFHSYKNAPKAVAFLRSKHRHIFKCWARIQVLHQERELEFFLVKRSLEHFTEKFERKSNCGSCESIALQIAEFIKRKYGAARSVEVEVSEDGENSAGVIL